ncbi:hypothetical protein, partial [Klebsiella pneumoniae]|uniref:hypothetical protein n=1 Tax=Klebsiella pneumoniae TaxID=573 RepID=UPI00301391B5
GSVSIQVNPSGNAPGSRPGSHGTGQASIPPSGTGAADLVFGGGHGGELSLPHGGAGSGGEVLLEELAAALLAQCRRDS